MLSEIKLEQRPAQTYVAIRSNVSMREIGTKLPPLVGEVFAWVGARGLSIASPMLWRYVDGKIDNMETGTMTVDVAIPVDGSPTGDEHVIVDTLPAGRYAVVLYTGDYSGLHTAHGALQDWCAQNHIPLQQQREGDEQKWGARVEVYFTDPAEEPDPTQWKTEVAFLTA